MTPKPKSILDFTTLACIAYVFFINVIDAFLTLVWLKANIAFEANPLMAITYGIHPVLFVLSKFLIGTAALYFLWSAKHAKPLTILIVTAALFATYTWLLLVHVDGCVTLINALAAG